MMNRYMLEVTGCCCGFNLRSGTQILLMIGLVWSIIHLLGTMGTLVVGLIDNDHKVDPGIHSLYYPIHLTIFSFVPCALGVYAVFNKKPSYLKPYILVSIFEILLQFMLILIVVITAKTSGDFWRQVLTKLNNTIGDLAGQKIVLAEIIVYMLLIWLFFNWYFLSVVYQYYKLMKEEEENESHASQCSVPTNICETEDVDEKCIS